MKRSIALTCLMIMIVSIPGANMNTKGYQAPPDEFLNEIFDDPPSKMTGLYDGLITYEDTALIVNDNSEASKEIGSYFAMRRGLPTQNIINITAPTDEVISFSEFDEMMTDISDILADRGLTESIDYLVTTKGVPLKITSGYTNMNDQRYYYGASVDSELMLMDSDYENSIHGIWWIDNPYFDSDEPFSREQYSIRLVSRLTGYTVEEAKRLVDLAEPSFGVRGEAYLDMDPRKGIGTTGYGVGNKWMSDANDWFVENNWTSHLDNTNTFQTDMTNVSAYFSWGSNDGSWGTTQMSNNGFEAGTGPLPSGWIIESTGGTVERTTETKGSGSWSLKITRNQTGVLKAYQDVPVNYYDHRYIADGRMRISGVTSPGARIILEGYDGSGTHLWTHTLANRTGTRNWNYYQDPIENRTGTTRIRYTVELLGDGIVYFDQVNMRAIRPHNEWIPGSIAETIVSTGGRSQTYGTWYGQSLVADLIRDGVTGLKGYAWEPFIGAVSHADILFPAYYTGYNLAESFWMGSEISSWMGYVVGDPKCTPYINERADMGFNETDPLVTYVDDDGIPHLSITLYNKGKRIAENGSVELFVDNASIWTDVVSIDPSGHITLDISSDDEAIIGTHRFKIVLNGDGNVWEYDGKNNILDMDMTVNSIPEMEMSIETNQISRTEPLNITVSIDDDDGNISIDLLDIEIVGPSSISYTPTSTSMDDQGRTSEFGFQFTPPWNSTLGFYSVRGRYVDRKGSFAEELLYSSFKVVNNVPTLEGALDEEEVERGGEFSVNLSWIDPDTPDGSLDIEIYATRTLGGKLNPSSSVNNSNNSRTYYFDLTPKDASGAWSIIAEATDRDRKSARWETIIRTFNRPPTMEVFGLGQNVTRQDKVSFSVRYLDPEERSSSIIRMSIFGPVGAGSTETVMEMEFSLDNNGTRSFIHNPRYLAIGQYGIQLEFEDDERAGDIIVIDDLFTIHPLSPIISEPVITYDEGDGPPGGDFIRGEPIQISIPIMDPDSIGGELEIEATLVLPDLSEKEMFVDSRGDGIFRGKLNTDGSWNVGRYSMRISAVDDDGMKHSIAVEDLFNLDAEYPIFDEGSVLVLLNGTVECEVTLGIFPSSSQPVSMAMYLFDGNDTLLATIDMPGSGGFGAYNGEGSLEGRPVRGAILVMDDLGRSFWLNETLEFDYKTGKLSPGDVPDESGDEDDTMLYLILIIIMVLFVILIVLIMALILRRSRDSKMVAPPPMPITLPGQGNAPGLPGMVAPGLPPAEDPAITGSSTEELPPGRLINGEDSTYHRPEQTATEPTPEVETNMDVAPAPVTDNVPMAPNPIVDTDALGIDVPLAESPQHNETPSAPDPALELHLQEKQGA